MFITPQGCRSLAPGRQCSQITCMVRKIYNRCKCCGTACFSYLFVLIGDQHILTSDRHRHRQYSRLGSDGWNRDCGLVSSCKMRKVAFFSKWHKYQPPPTHTHTPPPKLTRLWLAPNMTWLFFPSLHKNALKSHIEDSLLRLLKATCYLREKIDVWSTVYSGFNTHGTC